MEPIDPALGFGLAFILMTVAWVFAQRAIQDLKRTVKSQALTILQLTNNEGTQE